MQFKVPQFLDIEDKIFGPFTFRQFVYLAGGAGICFVIFRLLGFILGAIPIIMIAGFSGLLAFYRPNNKPFINMLESVFKFFLQDKLYVWKKEKRSKKDEYSQRQSGLENIDINQATGTPRLTEGKLRDLAWSLDVLDSNRSIGGGQEQK